MKPPPSPMAIDSSPSKGKNKRPASPMTSPQVQPSTTPTILSRRHHRRRNVAALLWGPEIRSTTTLTAPARFNVYKSLLRHPNLFFQFALRLPLPTILSLYAIDKEFHYRLNKFSVSLMHDYARYHAPLASWIFAWILYPHLCISDPMLRPMDGRAWLARDVPGFRWIGMVMWREKVVRRILTHLAAEGSRVPEAALGTLMKFWCIMEMKSSAMRASFLQAGHIWEDGDFECFHLVYVKLSMRFADPILGNGAAGLPHLLLSQRSLGLLGKVLSGRVKLDYDNVTEMVTRTYAIEDLDTEGQPWLDDEMDNGVPEEEWGLLSREGWLEDGEYMESAVDMVIKEGVRRGLHVQEKFLDFVLWGSVDEQGSNVPVPRRGRRGVGMVEVGWPGKEERLEAVRELDERFDVWGKKDESREGEAMDVDDK